jgi:hypothetical protein
MKEFEHNPTLGFLQGWYLDDNSICDKIIKYHNASPNKSPGWIGQGQVQRIDKTIKDSIDVVLESSLWNDYVDTLSRVVNLYIDKFSYCNFYSPFGILEPVIVQYYPPGGGYFKWHCERTGLDASTKRHLVFMTYLNDVSEGGETEFYYQNIKVNARKGLTLVWPADWTHTHRGLVSNTQEKYIVTGWLNYHR